MYYVGVHRGLNFLSVDPLPYVQVPPGEAKVVLERLEVSALISGMFAETTQTLTFRNPNRRALEGTLLFPLPEGAVVCGYAIDLDGELVDGVIVPKQEARRILEAEIRKGVDPGLVEQVQGNVYRTRIYPLPPSGTRTIRIVYVTELACDGVSAAYHLPLAHAQAIDHVSLRVEIKKGEVHPELSGGLGNLSLAPLRDSFVGEATLPRGTACDDLLVRLPDLPRHLCTVERHGDETFFAISSALPTPEVGWEPRRVALLWDASGSRSNIELDLALVSALHDRWPSLVVDVRVVRNVVDAEMRSFAGLADREPLLRHLRELPRDGGSALAALDLKAVPHADDEAWLVFSDGQNTIGRGLPDEGALPIIAISSVAGSDSAYLRHLATRSGGIYIDLVEIPAESAIPLVASATDSLRVTAAEGCADVHVRRAAGRLAIVGRLSAELGQLSLAGAGAPADHLSIARERAVEGRLVARAWTGSQTRALAVVDPNHPQILELARRHGVVTANASLLVLETLDQHLEYGIEPAASRARLHKQYVAACAKDRRDKLAVASSHLEQVVARWQKRVRWWETKFEVRPPADTTASAPHRASRSVAAPMAYELLAYEPLVDEPMFDEPMVGAMPAELDGATGDAAPGGPPAATIAIKPWSPDTPYLSKLRKADAPYAVYLAKRTDYATSPAFFLDCGDFFLARGDRALGLRVLSNLLELGLDDPALMRMYAWRLRQAGELDAAIDVLERVLTMRADEPQSHRDLALALAERWEQTARAIDLTRAMDLLYAVIEQEWERFPEIELIALMELNRMIARARERDLAPPERIDPRLVRLLDLDLRISMSWDLDLTDVDLHVFEPNGEHAYYGQNESSGGGLVSRDFIQGYGPEEYVRRRAQPGVYTIKAHYYGSHQQDIAGACTVIVEVTLDFGRPNEQRQVITLRLDHPSSEVVVGEVTFAGLPTAPQDWRPGFRKLRRGMTIDEVASVVGQPSRIEGTSETLLVYELGADQLVHVVMSPRLTAVRQVMDGAVLDLL